MSRVPRVRDLDFQTPIFLWNRIVDIVEFATSRISDERGDHTWGQLTKQDGQFAPGFYKLRGYGGDEMVLYEASGLVRANSTRPTLIGNGRELGMFHFAYDRNTAQDERRRGQ